MLSSGWRHRPHVLIAFGLRWRLFELPDILLTLWIITYIIVQVLFGLVPYLFICFSFIYRTVDLVFFIKYLRLTGIFTPWCRFSLSCIEICLFTLLIIISVILLLSKCCTFIYLGRMNKQTSLFTCPTKCPRWTTLNSLGRSKKSLYWMETRLKMVWKM